MLEKKFKVREKPKKITLSDYEARMFADAFKKHPKQGELFARNTLVSMVSTLDTLFSKLFEYYYTEHPSKLSIENKQITFSELKSIKKIEEAQKFLISREVEILLLKNGFKERLKILKEDLGISIPEDSQHIKDIKKLVKIRNLIVHNEGRADEEFVSLYGDGKIKKGELIKVGQKYLADALNLVYFVGSYILQIAQIKLSSGQIKTEDFILNDATHLLLKKEQYTFLRPMYEVAIGGGLDDLNQKMIVINYCIGLKRQGKTAEHIGKVLEVEDWSSAPDYVEMALEALRGNEDNFYVILNKLIKNKTISKDELSEWEIFCFYKKKPKFKIIQKKLLG
ncbi:MAG: hypothetical protein WC835_01530 [Candidatus Paceibacterota bacterium]